MMGDEMHISRRALLGATTWLPVWLATAGGLQAKAGRARKGMVQTVLGPIPPDELGLTLPHEHVVCDFAGAEATNPATLRPDDVVNVMRPWLLAAKAKGLRGFVDCTPAYIGRDVRVLHRLSRETGLHILTNTGYYGAAGDKYLPKHARTETADQLAARWVREWEEGIEGTDIRPGFIKIGVDPAAGQPPRLSELDAKIVRAAAKASKRTGLVIASHTGQGAAAIQQLAILAEEGVPASSFIFVHADGEELAVQLAVARKGAWIELDGLNADSEERHVRQVVAMLREHPNRLLLSHDAGWYQVGEPKQNVRGFTYLMEGFLPALRRAGVTEAQIRQITVQNPAQAFALRAA